MLRILGVILLCVASFIWLVEPPRIAVGLAIVGVGYINTYYMIRRLAARKGKTP
jgi:hypothetical protein